MNYTKKLDKLNKYKKKKNTNVENDIQHRNDKFELTKGIKELNNSLKISEDVIRS